MNIYFHSGPHSLGLPWKVKLGSVGTVVPHVRNRINEPDADGNGEVSDPAKYFI